MFEILEVVHSSYKEFLDQGDYRVKDWPLMQSPFHGLVMIVIYLYFIKVAGPQFMKNRKPFEFRRLMAVYNFGLVFINLYLLITSTWCIYISDVISWKCQPMDYSNNPNTMRLIRMAYYYYLLKFVEFADTIFFVLRKKNNQITALHVIHHSLVPFAVWFPLKFVPGGYIGFFPYVNTLVHVIMYTYYGLAALGDKYKKYLFWKKYMTTIQLGQFVIVFIHTISLWYNQCEVSYVFLAIIIGNAVLFFVLFFNFYLQNYTTKSSQKKSPVFLRKEESSRVFKKKASEPVSKNGDSHLESEMEKEVDYHMNRQHSCDSESCCHIRCRISNDGMKNGKQNYGTPEAMKSLRNGYSSSVPESLKVQKIHKEI